MLKTSSLYLSCLHYKQVKGKEETERKQKGKGLKGKETERTEERGRQEENKE